MIFAMQFGSLLDGILIGNMIGGDALGAASLVSPILYFIQIPGFALGVGGSIVVANLLGKRDLDGAKKAFTIAMVIGIGVSLIIAAIAFLVARPLAALFSDMLEELSYQYILGYMLTDPLIALSLLVGSFMAVDNNPRLSSIFFIIANVGKVGFEVLFVKTFGDWSLFGAAISTGAGYLLGLLLTFFFYLANKKRLLKFSFSFKNNHLLEVLKSSSTSALNFFLTAVQMLIVNIVISSTLTTILDINVFGLVANMVFAFDLLCGGIINLIPTICGVFYGEKDFYSLKSITKKIYFINIIVTATLTAFILIFPNIYSMLFGYTDMNDFDYVAMILRVYLISFIPYEINKFSMNYYPSIDKNSPSLILVLMRELVIVLPVTLTLLHTNGLLGYCIACAVTEIASCLLMYLYVFIFEKVRMKHCHGPFMFEKSEYESLDVSIDNNLENASKISETLTRFALEHNIPNRESQIVGLASEEIVNNIITYGYNKEKSNYIDINLKIMKDMLLLRVRDDGVPFDPTSYEHDKNENYSLSGIELIKNLTNKMSYARILNLNNTTFEINIKGEN